MKKIIKEKEKRAFILKYIIIFFELLCFKYFILNKNIKVSSIYRYNLKNNNSYIIILRDNIAQYFKKNISRINTLYIKTGGRFGNYFISLNNAIIFCEFLSCKRIIIKHKYIKYKIFYHKYNLTIESNKPFNFSDNSSFISDVGFFLKLNLTDLGKVNRFYVFREEILNNLPKVKISLDELYIYIRGGDIFWILNKTNPYYTQPPLCFYKKVLNEFTFKKVNIISEDISNPVILILLKEYPYIKYNKKNMKLDISYLLNSYNIISATSSFIASIIKLNQNLKFLWEYDFYKLKNRYLFLHYSVYTFSFNYTIYKMNVSENYEKLMYPFHNSENQRKLMIEEKCDNNFHLIPPRIT